MKGYIYYIINIQTKKRYVGKTINLEHRLKCHFKDLEKNKHHSHKLQRAYNKYGVNNFKVEYQLIEVKNEEELSLKEIEEINKWDSYNNGYNETYGGDGHKTSLDFETSVLIYHICQNYKGVHRQIANFYKCDHTVIDNLAKNNLYKNIKYSKQEYLQLIKKIDISENNKIENYIPHNKKKLSNKDIIIILSIIKFYKGYDKTLCQIFNINSKLIWRLKKELIYKDYITKFKQLTETQQKRIALNAFQKYDIENIKAQRQRNGVKNSLTQEQVNYILKNKDIKKRIEIAKDLNISADRVSSVCLGKSYKDLISNYYNSIN